jgi:septal ring factor EnvC (AmiA/AmiB activator)
MKSLGDTMIDASFSRQRHQEDRAVVGVRRLRVLAVALVIILIGLGCAMLWGFGSSTVAALPSNTSAVSAPAREQVADEILETAKGLGITQQQAVDQLQVVQDQLAMQKAETKRLSEQIAAVTEKLDALQQSIASIAAPPVATPVSPSKSRHQ